MQMKYEKIEEWLYTNDNGVFTTTHMPYKGIVKVIYANKLVSGYFLHCVISSPCNFIMAYKSKYEEIKVRYLYEKEEIEYEPDVINELNESI